MESTGRATRFLGVAMSVLGLAAYLWWWLIQGSSPNAITITLGLAFLALIVAHVTQIQTSDTARVTLIATWLWIFLGASILGLMYVASLIRGDRLVSSTLTTQILLIAAGLATYAVVILAVRYRWILRPSAQLYWAHALFPSELNPDDYPHVSPFADGYFIHENRLALTRRLKRIREATGEELSSEANQILATTKNYTSVQTERDSLKALLATLEGPSADPKRILTETEKALCEKRVRHLSSALTIATVDGPSTQTLYLLKVQNQLTVFAFVLLVAVAALAATGWLVPMGLAAISALVFRIRTLAPIGEPETYDGGARWMALFITPLIGAVSAVIGLYAVAALAQADLLSETLGAKLALPDGLGVETSPQHFSVLALGIAIAFGWSARLLDSMLETLTSRVSSSGEPNPKTPGKETDKDPETPTTVPPADDPTLAPDAGTSADPSPSSASSSHEAPAQGTESQAMAIPEVHVNDDPRNRTSD